MADYPPTGTTIRYLGTRDGTPPISGISIGDIGHVIPYNEGIQYDEPFQNAIWVQFPTPNNNLLGPNRDIIWLVEEEWELARTVPTLHEAFNHDPKP